MAQSNAPFVSINSTIKLQTTVMNFLNTAILSAFFVLCTLSNADAANWVLNADKSEVNFISIKKGNIAETHVFNDVSGHISDGKAQFTIKPDSVDSRIPIRNERMREFLFETKLYPTIEISANVNELLNSLAPAQSNIVTIPAMLSMHGTSKEINLAARVSMMDSETLLVSSTQSVLIRAANFDMVEGITKLASLVNNLPIAETVPVNFSLELTLLKDKQAATH